MDRLASQQPEDYNSKELRFENYAYTRAKSKNTKENSHIPAPRLGPPTKKAAEPKKVSFTEPVEQASTENPMPTRVAPNVELSPKVDKRLTQPVKDDTFTKYNPTAYKSRAPVELGLDIEKLVETVLDLEINIPLRNLAGVSGAIQKEIRKQVTKTRLPVEPQANVTLQKEKSYIRLPNIPATVGTFIQYKSDDIPEGYIVADDPVLQYLASHSDVKPSELIVASPSEPLRAIYAIINRVGQEECLIDNGSMIVSMAKDVAIQLGLTWDPSIQINMESASNHVEKTLGLARNICFQVGGLNLLLQVHILEDPPYRVLLGRPFDAHASSIVQTKENGSSELVLTDPNTKRIAIVPTYERGVGPEELQKQKYQSF